MKGYSGKIQKQLVAFLAVLLLKTIIKYFAQNNGKFKQLLLKSGFHPSIANNPFIVLNKQSFKNTAYFNFWAGFVLRVFAFSVKKHCWTAPRRQKLLQQTGFKQQYIENPHLFLKELRNYTNPYNELQIPKNTDIPKGKKVIYSVMLGNYDDVYDPLFVSEDCDYVLFTDNPDIKTGVWKIRTVEINEKYPIIWNVYYYRIMAHKVLSDYEYSIYIDSNIFICGDIIRLFKYVDDDKYPLVMFKHTNRNSIVEEIKESLKLKLIPVADVEKLYQDYLSNGFLDNLGLSETGIQIRKHNDARVIILMKKLMEEITKYPMRDQFNFMYALWATGMKDYRWIQQSLWNNQFTIVRIGHKQKRKLYK